MFRRAGLKYQRQGREISGKNLIAINREKFRKNLKETG
jgi:hypothetical protein